VEVSGLKEALGAEQDKIVLVAQTTNLELEGVMADYSVFFVFLLMLPVVMQIILPLLLLAGYGLLCAVKAVFSRPKVALNAEQDEKAEKELQLSRA
jgi:hypothetical protein